MNKNYLLTGLLLTTIFYFSSTLVAQTTCSHASHQHKNAVAKPLTFIENQNQWHENVRYQAALGGQDKVFLEDAAFTYLFHDAESLKKLETLIHDRNPKASEQYVDAHAYRVRFLNANASKAEGAIKLATYHNYFLGNDPDKWTSVPLFQKVSYKSLYDGIELLAYSKEGLFKYDFIVEAEADPQQIQTIYEGTNGLSIQDGQLHIQTQVGLIKEYAPYAYQIADGVEREVACTYRLENNVLGFSFPEGYDHSLPLIIDPTVVASTLSGTSGTTNYGHTATYDNGGNIYAGGRSFGSNYPTTNGAFQTNFGGGTTDSAITKYTPDGASQIFSTYIGGSGSDYPHSMIVDLNGQLCVYGSSTSSNYPTTGNSVQPNSGGAADIVITKFSVDGSTLIGSTYLGGSQNDGINNSNLNDNYGDDYRGEIVLDAQGNIYISSSSRSTDFPVTANAFQQNNNSTSTLSQDAVVAKLNSDLSTLFWATYLGSEDPDVGFGLRVDDFGAVYVTGVAGSADFPMAGGGVQTTWPGGEENGFVVKLSADGQQLLASTFFGSDNGDEHSFFIDLDEDNVVHIFGQTTGTIAVTPDTYFSNENSKQFIAGFPNNLSSIIYSTVIGLGPGGFGPDFVPVAFMVDKCNGIYLSGYQASSGLPTTSDALYASGSNDFYLAKLAPNATSLDFATYYPNAYHVDGGTSRFDKGGIVYQAVCSGSGSTLNTLDNAWSDGQANSWDIGVFKIDFEIATVTAAGLALPSASGCAPFSVDFTYTGQDAESYYWDFGGGATSTEMSPSHTFMNAGSYTVMQVVSAASSCNLKDTFYLQIDVLDDSTTSMDTTFCVGTADLFLDVSTVNANYLWQDGSTGATYQVNDQGVYWVDISIAAGCTRRDSFVVNSSTVNILDLGPDQLYCDTVNSVDLSALAPWAVSYEWNTGAVDPIISIDNSGNYSVILVDSEGCEATDSINISFATTPIVELGADMTLCEGANFLIDATTANATYEWQDGSTAPTYDVSQNGNYAVTVTVEGCPGGDELVIDYVTPLPLDLGVDQSFCDLSSYSISAETPSAVNYLWNSGLVDPVINISNTGAYSVTLTDGFGCETTDEIFLTFINTPPLNIGPDTTLCIGTNYIVDASTANGTYLWQDGSTASTFEVTTDGLYFVTVTVDGCPIEDQVMVAYEAPLPLELGSDQPVCDEATFTLDATTAGAVVYDWSTGQSGTQINVDASGNYSVTISDGQGCETVDDVDLLFTNTPVVVLGADTLLCEGEVANLSVSVTGSTNVEWQNGSTSSSYLVESEGIYWVTAESNGCVGSDSLEVIYEDNPAVLFQVNDLLCSGDATATIEAVVATGGTGLQYEWSNGATTGDISDLLAGNYQITVSNVFGCVFETDVTVSEPDSLSFLYSHEDVECYGDGNGWLTIEGAAGGVPPYNYSIDTDDFSQNTVYTNLDGGDYEVTLMDDNGCTESQTISIYEPAGAFLDAGPDQWVKLGDSVEIDAALFPDNNQIYEWITEDSLNCKSCLTPFAKPIYNSTYVIVSVDSITGCSLRDTMQIYVEKPRNVYIPNAFSPNGDGNNDVFYPYGDASVSKVNYFRIFDRWGALVYQANDFEVNNPDYGWDGRLDGKVLDSVVLVYVIEVEFVDGLMKIYKGDVTLFR